MRQANSPTRVEFVWLGKKILQANILILTKLSTCILRIYFYKLQHLKQNITVTYPHNSTQFGVRLTHLYPPS